MDRKRRYFIHVETNFMGHYKSQDGIWATFETSPMSDRMILQGYAQKGNTNIRNTEEAV